MAIVHLPLESMSTSEKLAAMEALWADLARSPASVPSPAWHGDILAERRKIAADAPERFENWSVAKAKLRDQLR